MKAGDIIAISGTHIYSRAIKLLTNCIVSHVGIALDSENVIEALTTVVERPFTESIADASQAWILSPKLLTNAERSILCTEARRWAGKSYGYGKIGMQTLDILCHTEYFTKSFSNSTHPICSFLVAEAYGALGYDFGKKQYCSITPADIFVYALNNPDKYGIEVVKR